MCHVRVYGDQSFCSACNLTWDTNDPDPPKCNKNTKRSSAKLVKFEAVTLPPVTAGGFPETLPHDLALEMVKAFKTHPTNQVDAMRAAYRILIDRLL